MEINLTISGVRNLPIEVTEAQLAFLSDPNAEFEITLIASPSGEETKFSQGEEPAKKVRKIRAIHVVNISVR